MTINLATLAASIDFLATEADNQIAAHERTVMAEARATEKALAFKAARLGVVQELIKDTHDVPEIFTIGFDEDDAIYIEDVFNHRYPDGAFWGTSNIHGGGNAEHRHCLEGFEATDEQKATYGVGGTKYYSTAALVEAVTNA